ncbi:hypothetical protein ACFYZH_09995 [Streptomyces abikoensis]|uniref:hypothetical protein n=1 Tax=Streptomyces abikoensis TaxID=97398 RepID=UPI00369A3A5C
MGNEAFYYDGARWVSAAKRYWDGKQWAGPPDLRVWDGAAWRSARPPTVEFPTLVGTRQASFSSVDTATLPLPDDVRLGDTIVSVCASYGGSTPTPRTRSLMPDSGPSRSQGLTFDPTKLHLQAAMYEWAPDKGSEVAWHVSGSKDTNAIIMTLVYRQANTPAIPPNPIIDYTTAMTSDRIALQAGTDYVSLYVALALSQDLTGGQWPEGFSTPIEAFGRFGEAQVHLMAAHTVAAAASPGILQLDATVPEVAVALITIPGKAPADGHGVWILGDSAASLLGVTTYVE